MAAYATLVPRQPAPFLHTGGRCLPADNAKRSQRDRLSCEGACLSRRLSAPSLVGLVVAALALGCSRPGSRHDNPSHRDTTASAPPSSAQGSPAAPHAPLALERVEIPTGSFEAGSLPGTEGRRPQLEQLLTAVELGPFSMDRMPFPNDPNTPPLTGVSRIEAAARCAERGARLCTELEWERACKGPRNEPYSTGARFEARCAQSISSCASEFDVLGLGTTLREWTASDVISPNGSASRGAVVRGAAASSAAVEHRCAKREVIKETERAQDVGFRCCHGAPNAAKVDEPALRAVFSRPALEPSKLLPILERDARTKALAKDWIFFREPDAAETVVSRGSGDRQGLRFTVAPLLWSPVAGTQFLLVTGRSGKDTSAVLAYHVIREGDYRLAASFIMKTEPGPVAFAYHESIRPRLFFSTCWKCPGETGRLLYREPDTIAIVQP